jgi:hypothetical protein
MIFNKKSDVKNHLSTGSNGIVVPFQPVIQPDDVPSPIVKSIAPVGSVNKSGNPEGTPVIEGSGR